MRSSTFIASFLIALWSVITPANAVIELETPDILLSPDGLPHDDFGATLALSGSRMLVASPHSDEYTDKSGSAFIFEPDANGEWTSQTNLIASDAAPHRNFGLAAALEGDLAVISAPYGANGAGGGTVYFFERQSDGTWPEVAGFQGSNPSAQDNMGWSIDISGNTVVVGAHSDDQIGQNAGAVYFFEKDGSTWQPAGKLTDAQGQAWDYFGRSVAIRDDTLLVGNAREDSASEPLSNGQVFHYERDSNGVWQPHGEITPTTNLSGTSFGVTLDLRGDLALIGTTDMPPFQETDPGGGVYVMEKGLTRWNEKDVITGVNMTGADLFGTATFSETGLIVASAQRDSEVGLHSGSASIYQWDGSDSQLLTTLLPTDYEDFDFFGKSMAMNDQWLAIGAPGTDLLSESSGAVYLYRVVTTPSMK